MIVKPLPLLIAKPLNSDREMDVSIQNFNTVWLKKHEYDDSKIFYHYTNIEGFKGIIQNRSLWFTHIAYLNDPNEWLYGKNLILDEILTIERTEKNKDVLGILERLKDFVNALKKTLHHPYVACFCENENSLNQWRAYSSARGYNLGLDLSSSTKYSHLKDGLANTSNFILRKVIYDRAEQEKLVKDFFNSVFQSLKDTSYSTGIIEPSRNVSYAVAMMNLLYDFIVSFKNEAFKTECEWRLIFSSLPNNKVGLLKFREIEKEMVPFYEAFIYRVDNVQDQLDYSFPLKQIYYSPMLETEKTEFVLRMFLNSEAKTTHPIKLNAENIKIQGTGYSLRK